MIEFLITIAIVFSVAILISYLIYRDYLIHITMRSYVKVTYSQFEIMLVNDELEISRYSNNDKVDKIYNNKHQLLLFGFVDWLRIGIWQFKENRKLINKEGK